MTRTIGNGSLTVELGHGTITLRWPALDLTLGPLGAWIETEGRELRAGAGPGRWHAEVADAYGRAGARARWRPADRGCELTVHVATDDPVAVVEAAYTAPSATEVGAVVPFAGPLDARARAVLVEGYDSWSYAGVRSGAAPRTSYWRTLVVTEAGPAIAAVALDASEHCTRFEVGAGTLGAACGPTPELAPVEGTWGFTTRTGVAPARPLAAGATVRSAPVALTAGHQPHRLAEELAALAGHASGARRWSGPPIAGWESWYHYGLFVEPADVRSNAARLGEVLAARPELDLVQVDDGWQRTYGVWEPNERWPADMGEVATELHARGRRAGLWIAPFMVQPASFGPAAEHPEWMLRDRGGATVVDRHGRHALDASHPEARAWLHDLGRRVRAWGFDMVKVDFLSVGAYEGARHDASWSGTRALHAGLTALVDGLGENVYVLACGAPLLPVVGLAHGNRVGHDLAVPVRLREFGQPTPAWNGMRGVAVQARNVAARAALHRRWFDCDPDVVMAWGSDGHDPDGYSLEESRTLAALAAACGGPYFLADDLATLAPAERAVLGDAELLPLVWGDGFRATDLFDAPDDVQVEHAFAVPSRVPSVWVVERGDRRFAVCFNWGDGPAALVTPDGRSVVVPAHGARLHPLD